MNKPRIHITAVASAGLNELQRVCLPDADGAATASANTATAVKELVRLAERALESKYRITVNAKMLTAAEDDRGSGRHDDAARAKEVEALRADDDGAAMVTIRGGAWFVRILDRINFDLLKKRRRPLYIFGFSEMTPLIAIAGQYPQAVGVHYLGPGFVYAGLKGWVQRNYDRLFATRFPVAADQVEAFAAGFAASNYRVFFDDFFYRVGCILQGRSEQEHIKPVPTGRLLSGKLSPMNRISVVGGNLSLILPMLGTRWASAFDPAGKWLALEEVNESPEQCDRMLAGLKHNGFFERAAGIMLGDFHDKQGAFTPAVADILKYHLPPRKNLPIIHIENFGHIWPMAPLPMHRPLVMRCARDKSVAIDIPWGDWTGRRV